MKVIVQQKKLKKALHIVERVASKNISLPILNSILLKTDKGLLKIISTNLEIGISASIGAKIEEVGEIVIPGRTFADFVNIISDENVLLSGKGNILNISTSKYKTKILGFDPKEYPTIPKLKSDTLSIIPAPILKNIISLISDSIAVSETRPELNGVYVQFLEKEIIFASTDSFRLTEKKIKNHNNIITSVIIPKNTITELLRVCNETNEDLTVRIDENQISFVNNDIEFVSRLVDGVYPDYRRVIPNKIQTIVTVSKNELEKSVRLAGIFASTISDIKIQGVKDKLIISSKNSDRGDVQATVPVKIQGDEFEISLNFNYLLDGLKIITTEDVLFCFCGENQPVILKQDNDIKDFLYIVMPLRN